MLNLLFFLVSFFPVNGNINDLINPYQQLDVKLYSIDKNNISYSYDFYNHLNNKNFDIYTDIHKLSGYYKYKFFDFSFEYQKKRDYFYYQNKEDADFFVKNNFNLNNLNFRTGLNGYNITLRSILNINFAEDLDESFNYGFYLAYHYLTKALKYKLSISKYENQEFTVTNIKNNTDNFKIPNRYKKKYQDLIFNLRIASLFELDIKNTFVDISSLDMAKIGFTFEESAKINSFILKTKLNINSYSLYFTYLENIIEGKSKGELDDVKYLKLIFKEYYSYSYNLGFIFKSLYDLDISLVYASFNSYIFGNIESWPFTDDESQWVGGRINMSSKPEYKRYMLRLKSNFLFFKQKLTIVPAIYYDKITINPNATTYEAGFMGIGKQNQEFYNKDSNYSLVHLKLMASYSFNKFKFNLLLSQVIPISLSSSGKSNTSTLSKSDSFGGFFFKFFTKFSF